MSLQIVYNVCVCVCVCVCVYVWSRVKPFIVQLMHTHYKILRLLK